MVPSLCQEHSLALSSLGSLTLYLFVPSIFYLLGFLLYQKCFKALFKLYSVSPFYTLLTYFNITCSPYQLYFLWPSNILYFTHLSRHHQHTVFLTSLKYKLHENKICWSVLFHAVSPLYRINLGKYCYLFLSKGFCLKIKSVLRDLKYQL